MTDTPTPVYGLRQQSRGSNTNTWGDDKLNDVIVALAQLVGNIKEITLTGNYTITSTNYVSTADNKNAGWDFLGTLSANATVTVQSSAAIFFVLNDTTGGYSVTVKTSAGTGVTIPNGRQALLRCDGVNVYNLFPTHMGTDFTPSLSGDAANVDYVETAIANASIPASSGTVLVSGSDTTAGYLAQKVTLSVGTATTTQLGSLLSVQLSTVNGGANEQLQLSVSSPYVAGFLDGGDKSAGFTPDVGTSYGVDCTASVTTVQLSSMTSPQLSQKICLSNFGNYPMLLKGTVNGATNLYVTSQQTQILEYRGASWGWN